MGEPEHSPAMGPEPSTAASTALTKRAAPGALMPPPPAPKRIKRPAIVLDEDTYTSAISHIIRRDFFPGLAETDAQQEYLNAVESGDKKWIREAGRVLVDVMTPGPDSRNKRRKVDAGGLNGFKTPKGSRGVTETPSVWGGDTPVTTAGETPRDEEGEGAGLKVDLNLSLGAFQAKYTSEDQESFSRILDRQNAARFARNEWLRTGNRYASKQRLAQQKVLEARQSSSTSRDLVVRPSQDLDDRPAHVSTHKHAPFNTLMFPPDSIESWAPTAAQRADSASLAPPKAVVHANTRVPAPDSADAADVPPRAPSPTMSSVRAAISERPRLSASEAAGSYTGSETPRVNGYAFVPARYEDESDNDDDDEDAPTDLLERLGANKGLSPFTISEAQRREKLHHKMVDKIQASRSGRASALGAGSAGVADTPRFLSAPTPGGMGSGARTPGGAGGMTPGRKNVGDLTPAAQRLFANVGGGKTPRVGGGASFGQARSGSGSGSGIGLGREWTPTPRVKRKT